MVDTVLSADSIVDIAKITLGKFSCKWGECQYVLNSWNMLHEHYHRHCRGSRAKEGTWHCRISGCAGSVHASTKALVSHVDLSHMSRLQVPCPIQGCDQSLLRTAQLPTHIHGFHPGLLGSVVTKDSKVLKSIYTPFSPKLPPPPPIPFGRRPIYDVDPLPVRKGKCKRKRAQSPQSAGPKWSRLNAQDDEDGEPDILDLDDLPRFDYQIDEVRDIIVRRKPPETVRASLSNAHRIVDPPPPDTQPPTSIHYDTFARKVEDLLASGLL